MPLPRPSRPGGVAPAAGATRRVRRSGAAATAAVLVLSLSACGGAASEAVEADPRLHVVTTVAPLTSIVSAVAGDRARVEGVVPEGEDSHTFDPPPRVGEVLSSADVVFVNGLGLEEPTVRLVTEVAPEARLVALGDAVLPEPERVYDFSFPREGGKPNPHLWTDPTYALRYSEVVGETLAAADPANAEAYRDNQAAFAALVGRLDDALRAATATVPRPDRELLTYHDAYAYFARTYDFTVVGAVQPDDFEDPTPAEIGAIIDQVRAEGVRVVFGSEVFPSPVLEQIGRETGARYEATLRDDDLPGAAGDPEHSWAELMRYDYVTIIEALGGDASALRGLDLSTGAPDRAQYPQ